MLEYRIYCVDEKNRVVSRHDHVAPDDLSALDKARELCGEYEIEAWQGVRMVARLTNDGTASREPDSLARTG
jgi:hypothetical protein